MCPASFAHPAAAKNSTRGEIVNKLSTHRSTLASYMSEATDDPSKPTLSTLTYAGRLVQLATHVRGAAANSTPQLPPPDCTLSAARAAHVCAVIISSAQNLHLLPGDGREHRHAVAAATRGGGGSLTKSGLNGISTVGDVGLLLAGWLCAKSCEMYVQHSRPTDLACHSTSTHVYPVRTSQKLVVRYLSSDPRTCMYSTLSVFVLKVLYDQGRLQASR